MREITGLFNAAFFFFIPVALIYGVLTDWTEPVGPIAMGLLGIMGLMVSMYTRSTLKRLDADPADNPRGDQWEQEGEYGFFSPHSWWPLALAFSAMLVFVGLGVGWWLFLVGLVFAILSLIGWTFEYFHQDMTI